MKTIRPLLEKYPLNRICNGKPNLSKNSSTNLFFALTIGTTTLQFVDFLVMQHIDVLPNYFWRSIVSEQPTHFLFLSQWLILLGSRLVFQQFVKKMTLSCRANYLFAHLSAIIFFCYSHQFLHRLETPKSFSLL